MHLGVAGHLGTTPPSLTCPCSFNLLALSQLPPAPHMPPSKQAVLQAALEAQSSSLLARCASAVRSAGLSQLSALARAIRADPLNTTNWCECIECFRFKVFNVKVDF